MGFAEKRRRRAGNFGEVNDFCGRDFQINTKPSQRLIAGNGNKNSGGENEEDPPLFLMKAQEKMEQKNKRDSVLSRTIVRPRP